MKEIYVIHVTKECNMSCLYCYEKDKTSKYSWEEIKALIDNIIKYNKEFRIEFLGGEPLLAFDLIKKSYDYLESFKDVNVLSYVITNNGTILNEEIINFIKSDKRIHYAVSIDGNKTANQLRMFKNSYINSYDVVINNLKIAIKEIDQNQIGVHLVIHPYNVYLLKDSIIELYNLGIKGFGIGTIESTMEIDKRYCNEFIKQLDMVSKMIVNKDLENISIDLFNYLKPNTDVRNYIKDNTGKIIGESYGRSGKDITEDKKYNTIHCTNKDYKSNLIYELRKTVYINHQNNINSKE